ncbi:MAG: right-handed parallel beta-helix repeat-containing protein [Candidatus Thorarchaeota archaeon]
MTISQDRDTLYFSSDISQPAQISHDPLYISHDSDFQYYGFPGSGTKEDPYILENLMIGSIAPCLSISYTSAYFIVRDCFFEAELTLTEYIQGAITLNAAANGVFDNCVLAGGEYNLVMFSSQNIVIKESTLMNPYLLSILNYYSSSITISNTSLYGGGIQHYSPSTEPTVVFDNCSINNKDIGYFHGEENQIIDGSNYGIAILERCRNVTIKGVSVSNVTMPIQLLDSNNCSVEACDIEAPYYTSIYINHCSNLTISDNVLKTTGILISETYLPSWQSSLRNNTLNGKEIGYFGSYSNLIIKEESYGQLFIVECENVSITDCEFDNTACALNIAHCTDVYLTNLHSENISMWALYSIVSERVRFQSCEFSNVSTCIQISGIENVSISDCTFLDCYRGIYAGNVEGFEIFNNSISSINSGVEILSAHTTRISNNTIYAPRGAIIEDFVDSELSNNSFHDCSSYAVQISGFNSVVTSNIFTNCRNGIVCETGWSFVIQNMILSAMDVGIQLVDGYSTQIYNCEFNDCGTGLKLINCEGCTVNDCLSTDSLHQGISVVECSGITFNECLVTQCQQIGLYIEGSTRVNLRNSTIQYCELGVSFANAVICEISWTSISTNSHEGIVIEESEAIDILNSSVTNNELNGLEILDSTNCRIISNIFANNSGFGIMINGSSSENSIYDNIFENNLAGNALDNTAGNWWDNQEDHGNYWDDWDSGEYYQIPGTGGAIDHYPMKYPFQDADFFSIYGPTLIAASVLVVAMLLVVIFREQKAK